MSYSESSDFESVEASINEPHRPRDFILGLYSLYHHEQTSQLEEYILFYQESNPAQIHDRNDYGETLLHTCKISNVWNPEMCVRFLVSVGADLEAKNNRGETVLSYYIDDLAMVQTLMDLGADPYSSDSRGCAAIHKCQNKDVLRHLFQEKGMDINHEDGDGCTILHHCHYPDMAIFLISLGADVNHRCRLGRTPLFADIWSMDFPMIDVLLKNGAELNVTDNQGMTPLDYYLANTPKKRRDYDFLDVMKERGAVTKYFTLE